MSFDGRSYLGLFPPPEYSFRWYKSFFSDTYYLQGLKTSLIIAVIATVISTTIGVSAAIGLDRYQGRGKQVLESLFLSPLVVPAVVIGFAILIFGNLLWRLICEAWILFFRIHESLVSIEHNTSGGQDIDEQDTDDAVPDWRGTDESWVNCAIQDCSNKVSLGKGTKYCAIHIDSDGE